MFEVYSFTHFEHELCLEAQFMTLDEALICAKEIHSQFPFDDKENGICIMYNKHWLMNIEEDY